MAGLDVVLFGLPGGSTARVVLTRKSGAFGITTQRAPYSALAMYGTTPLVARVRPISRIRAGILAPGSPYRLRLPILTDSGISSFRPRSQRRHRDGISPSSLVAVFQPPVAMRIISTRPAPRQYLAGRPAASPPSERAR